MHDHQNDVVYIDHSAAIISNQHRMSSRTVAKAADVLERWYNLLEQESTTYKTINYLTTLDKTANDKDDTFDTDVDLIASRSELFAWMYALVDKYSLDRELVAVAAQFKHRLYLLTGIDSDSDEVTVCRDTLKKIYQEAKVKLDKKNAAAAAIVTP